MLDKHPRPINLGQRIDIRHLDKPMLPFHCLEYGDRFRRLADPTRYARTNIDIDVTTTRRLATHRFDQHVETTFTQDERPLEPEGPVGERNRRERGTV